MDHKKVEKYILSLPGSWLDYPFGEGVAVYKAKSTDNKMFALIQEGKIPLRISLKCDPKLAEILRQRYDEVLPGYHLNKKHWNTIILSGQLSWQEIQDLINHSYQLVTDQNSIAPTFE
jgi:predicted DNA-binding protein (MmcQ/YjbR family)